MGVRDPAGDEAVFELPYEDFAADYDYWTETAVGDLEGQAYAVSFTAGQVLVNGKAALARARCVR